MPRENVSVVIVRRAIVSRGPRRLGDCCYPEQHQRQNSCNFHGLFANSWCARALFEWMLGIIRLFQFEYYFKLWKIKVNCFFLSFLSAYVCFNSILNIMYTDRQVLRIMKLVKLSRKIMNVTFRVDDLEIKSWLQATIFKLYRHFCSAIYVLFIVFSPAEHDFRAYGVLRMNEEWNTHRLILEKFHWCENTFNLRQTWNIPSYSYSLNRFIIDVFLVPITSNILNSYTSARICMYFYNIL